MEADLFGENKNVKYSIPLAERLRPDNLDEFFGQEHLTSEDKPISLMIEKQEPVNMIFWGPPGTGKTTLALIIANKIDADFIQLSAVSSGVKDVRAAIEKADYNQKKKNKKDYQLSEEQYSCL